METEVAASVEYLAVRSARDPQMFEIFLNKYKPFIFAQVSKTTGRKYVDEHDDVASIGLIAFHEAVQSYSAEKGNFLLFAGIIIRRRVIDQMRKDMRVPESAIKIDEERDETDDEYPMSEFDRKMYDRYYEDTVSELRRLEIEQFTKELAQWDISLRDVYKDAPKHQSRRDLLWKVIDALLSEEELLNILINKRYLPVARLAEELKLHRKKIEKARRYILACVIIAKGDYPTIREYLKI